MLWWIFLSNNNKKKKSKEEREFNQMILYVILLNSENNNLKPLTVCVPYLLFYYDNSKIKFSIKLCYINFLHIFKISI